MILAELLDYLMLEHGMDLSSDSSDMARSVQVETGGITLPAQVKEVRIDDNGAIVLVTE